MALFVKGQRWISEREPELGLGVIESFENNRVAIHFSVSRVLRQYSAVTAPLRRVIFQKGDTVILDSGIKLVISGSTEKNGLIYYHLQDHPEICESMISGITGLNSPEKKLKASIFDHHDDFLMRFQSLEIQHFRLGLQNRGFSDARINLLPHQLFVSSEVASRHSPRVMLADEVGLGKTIEACLILNHLILTGRVSRVLILVPEHLLFQWYAELFHRFHLGFQIMDLKTFAQFVKKHSALNPFDDSQKCLSSLAFFNRSETLASHALLSDWDLIITDEAHLLHYDTNEYKILQNLSHKTKGLILITAVPDQGGNINLFYRLKLLDPERYGEYAKFQQETSRYEFIAGIAEKISSCKELNAEETVFLTENLPDDLHPGPEGLIPENKRSEMIAQLTDLYGIGRVLFRNSRKNIPDFPVRKAERILLQNKVHDSKRAEILHEEFLFDAGVSPSEPDYRFQDDPRIGWLAEFLKKTEKKKVLLICHSVRKAEAIYAALQKKYPVSAILFHEKMDFIDRDKKAAWFSTPEGARLLIASEIGSEGRNFQFCSDLIFFDLPLDFDLIEQRIGRLDRIGQKNTVHIHLPVESATPQAMLSEWMLRSFYNFSKPLEGAGELLEQNRESILSTILEYYHSSDRERILDEFCRKTIQQYRQIEQTLERGKSLLLEIQSYRKDEALKLLDELRNVDENIETENYLLDFFDYIGIHCEVIGERTCHLTPGSLKTDAFPVIEESGMSITFDRDTALRREDLAFITPDHPLLDTALQIVLGQDKGNCSLITLPAEGSRELILDTVFILESIADTSLNIYRFLPPSPLMVSVNHHLEMIPLEEWIEIRQKGIADVSSDLLKQLSPVIEEYYPLMMEECRSRAETEAQKIIDKSLGTMKSFLKRELNRLKYLKTINNMVSETDILTLESKIRDCTDALQNSRLRLDSIRMIWKA